MIFIPARAGMNPNAGGASTGKRPKASPARARRMKPESRLDPCVLEC